MFTRTTTNVQQSSGAPVRIYLWEICFTLTCAERSSGCPASTVPLDAKFRIQIAVWFDQSTDTSESEYWWEETVCHLAICCIYFWRSKTDSLSSHEDLKRC